MLCLKIIKYHCHSLCDIVQLKQLFISKYRIHVLVQANSNKLFAREEGLGTSRSTQLFKIYRSLNNSNVAIQPQRVQTKKRSQSKSLKKYGAIPSNLKGEISSILHHAKRGLICVFPEDSLKSPDFHNHLPNDDSVSLTCNLEKQNNEDIFLLREARRQISNLKEDIEYSEEIGDESVPVKPVISQVSVNELEWRKQEIDVSKLPTYYASLAKSRLTGLVVLTSMAGYIIAPSAFDPLQFILCSVGTALVSSSANSINQFIEVPFDSQMDRTKNRVLVRGLLTPLHTISFGMISGLSGLSILLCGVNEVAFSLGLLNLILYTSVYTPMKRVSIFNTWIGSVVGAIPPLIGWAACTGSLNSGSLILGGILFAWQFPHFNALSWNLRQDYSRAGYMMMSVCNPSLCKKTSLRYCAAILLLSTLSPVCGVTSWTFAVDSLPFNLYFMYLAWKFYKEGDSKTSRNLFRFSLIHLPVIMVLMIISRSNTPSQTAPIVEALPNTDTHKTSD